MAQGGRKAVFCTIACGIAWAATGLVSDAQPATGGLTATTHQQLAAVRRATANYHDVAPSSDRRISPSQRSVYGRTALPSHEAARSGGGSWLRLLLRSGSTPHDCS
jgi:hypothetical protein